MKIFLKIQDKILRPAVAGLRMTILIPVFLAFFYTPAYADDCLALSSKFRKQPPQVIRESQLIVSLRRN